MKLGIDDYSKLTERVSVYNNNNNNNNNNNYYYYYYYYYTMKFNTCLLT
jgi:hypothetical protein